MSYSRALLDHYENPRNVGALDVRDASVGTALVGAPSQGEVIKLQIRVDDTGVIRDARFKTYGCCAAIAASSLATEWVKGRTLVQALGIRSTEIAKELDLPSVKIHCSILAEEAIKAAIQDYKGKQE
jgi:nitrogen fixation NifU-like protein